MAFSNSAVNRSWAAQDARDKMARHCGAAGYTIAEEGEEEVGLNVSRSGSVRPDTEYRVHYRCGTER